MPNYLKPLKALSLDIVIGSVLFSGALGTYFRVSLPVVHYAVLAIAVWLIYTFDHLMDTYRVSIQPDTPRHHFHIKYRKPITIVASFLFFLELYLIIYLPWPTLIAGIGLGLLIAIYFFLIKFTTFWAKEVLVALGYTVGVLVGPITQPSYVFEAAHGWLLLQVFLFALINLCLFSYFDFHIDSRAGSRSLATKLGQRHAFQISTGLVVIAWLPLIFQFYYSLPLGDNPIQIFFAVMLVMLSTLVLFPSFVQKNEMYRDIGDGIFFIPGIYWIFIAIF